MISDTEEIRSVSWNTRETIQVRMTDNSTRQIEAAPVQIPGYEKYKFFVHTSQNPAKPVWVVTEASTGIIIADGMKWYDAVYYAKQALQTLDFDTMIKDFLSKNEKLN